MEFAEFMRNFMRSQMTQITAELPCFAESVKKQHGIDPFLTRKIPGPTIYPTVPTSMSPTRRTKSETPNSTGDSDWMIRM